MAQNVHEDITVRYPYTLNALNIFFERCTEWADYRDETIAAVTQKANEYGVITDWDNPELMNPLLKFYFEDQCSRDPLTYFGPDMERLGTKFQLPYMRLGANLYHNAKHEEVVLEGCVMFVFGGIPGHCSHDVHVLETGGPTIYWHPDMLEGWGGRVQVVMYDQDGWRGLYVRQAPP